MQVSVPEVQELPESMVREPPASPPRPLSRGSWAAPSSCSDSPLGIAEPLQSSRGSWRPAHTAAGVVRKVPLGWVQPSHGG